MFCFLFAIITIISHYHSNDQTMKKATTVSSAQWSFSLTHLIILFVWQSSKGSVKSGKTKYMKIDEGQLKYAFAMIDSNRDGKLNMEEMQQMLGNIGIDVSDKVIRKVIKEASKNGNCLFVVERFLGSN